MNMAVLGGALTFLGPCIPLRVGAYPEIEGASSTNVWAALPYVLMGAAIGLAALGSFRMSRVWLDDHVRQRFEIAAAIGALVCGVHLAGVASVFGVLSADSSLGGLVMIVQGLGAYAWLAAFAWGMLGAAFRASLPTASGHWKVTLWLALGTLTLVVLSVASLLAGGVSGEAGVVVVIVLMVLGMMPIVATICFFLAASATHRTLRTIHHGDTLRRPA
jgi:hypothetical protein